MKKIVPDTSVLINGNVSEMIRKGKIKKSRIIIPKAVVDELQAQASRGKDVGFQGLEEIKRIRELGKEDIKIEFGGERPTLEEIQLAKKGRIDALIKDVAVKEKARLLTSDYVQALVGEAEGVSIMYIEPPEIPEKTRLEKLFTSETQSVHLKANVVPVAKRGKPGRVELVKLGGKKSTEKEIKEMINEVVAKARKDEDSFIEIGKQGALVVQMGEYRISIARPPFSDGLELTAVRPIAKVSLDDYELHEELKSRIVAGSQGVLIAGPPGSGKSTFAASVAEFLSGSGKIVKTFEQPRDLQVGPEVTQYAPLEGSWEKTAELLLLVRPDYTIFDEIRKTKDFHIFGDMRLAGVGMIGVVHATSPVSAIQRFIGRLELGAIPHVIDTVIYIKDGRIERTYELSLTVKVPSGMKDEDLARPVVEIRDFASNDLMYEIYTFGEENVIIPVEEEKMSPVRELAAQRVYDEIKKWDPKAQVEVVSDGSVVVRVSGDTVPKLIGKRGQNIERIEKKLGVRISVEPKGQSFKGDVDFSFEETGGYFNLWVRPELVGEKVDIYDGEDFLFSPVIGKLGQVKVRKRSAIGKRVLRALTAKRLRILT